MDANDDFNGKELNLNCFYMHTIFGQKYPKPAIVYFVKFEVIFLKFFKDYDKLIAYASQIREQMSGPEIS